MPQPAQTYLLYRTIIPLFCASQKLIYPRISWWEMMGAMWLANLLFQMYFQNGFKDLDWDQPENERIKIFF